MTLADWLAANDLTPLAKHLAGQHDQLKHGRRRGADGQVQPGRGEIRREQIERGRKEYQQALARITPERRAKGEARIAAMNARAAARTAAAAAPEPPAAKKASRKKPAPKTPDTPAAPAPATPAETKADLRQADSRTVRVPANSLDLLEARVAELNDRARKKGLVGGYKLGDVSDPFDVEIDHPRHGSYKVAMVNATIHGVLPRLPGGWKFVAAVDHGGHHGADKSKAGNIISAPPGAEGLAEKWGHEEARCDHCGHNRDRKHTIIVANDQGEHKMIGRSCVKDFLGRDVSVPQLTKGDSDDLDDFLGGAGSARHHQPKDVLANALAVVDRSGGYESRERAGYGNSTGDLVRAQLEMGPIKDNRGEPLYPVTEQHHEQAAKILEWVRSGGVGRSDYGHNVGVALADDEYGVDPKRVPLAASAVAAWHRHQADEKDRARAQAETAWLGKPGEKLEIAGKIAHVRNFGRSDFGGYYAPDRLLLTIEHDGQTVQHWTTSNTALGRAEAGSSVTFRATVKQHTTDNKDRKITEVQRPSKVQITPGD